MNYIPLNLALMGNPLNWVVITLMILLGGFALALLTSLQPSADSD
jgi:hypothetical protein